MSSLEGEIGSWAIGYSIADIMLAPWMKALDFYGAKAYVGYEKFERVIAWESRFFEREAVQRGVKVCPMQKQG